MGVFERKMNYPNIEKERIRLSLTKVEFAKRIGITTRAYYNYQNGRDIPSSTLINLKKVTGKSIDYLLEQE